MCRYPSKKQHPNIGAKLEIPLNKLNKSHRRIKDIAHVAIQGATAPHDMLPGTEGASDNQNVPPSTSSTFGEKINKRRKTKERKSHQQ